jgi:hypothetical protein
MQGARELIRIEIDQHDFGAVREQSAHGGKTDTAGAAGDDTGFSFDQP